MKPIAIFISCDSFEKFFGGVFGLSRDDYIASYRNDFVWEYALGLRHRGHETFIYVLSYGPPELKRTLDGVNVRFLPLPAWLRLVDPLLFRSRKVPFAPAIRDRVAFAGYGRAFLAALCEDDIEAIYHQEIWTPRFDIVTKATNVPVIGADQGAVYAPWMARSKHASMRRARHVLCQSVISLERARAFGAQAVLMYNGVDTDFFKPPRDRQRRPKTVLAVGRLDEEQKRFSDLLHALRALPDFCLTLVGRGPQEMMLKDLAAELGIAHRVTFAGFITDRSHLRRLYQECGVFVSTSSWEALALVVLEAMSCGAPIVATRIPSFTDLLTDGVDGVLIPLAAPGEVARAIEVAHERQEDLGERARETVVTRYSSHSLYDRLSALVEAT